MLLIHYSLLLCGEIHMPYFTMSILICFVCIPFDLRFLYSGANELLLLFSSSRWAAGFAGVLVVLEPLNGFILKWQFCPLFSLVNFLHFGSVRVASTGWTNGLCYFLSCHLAFFLSFPTQLFTVFILKLDAEFYRYQDICNPSFFLISLT